MKMKMENDAMSVRYFYDFILFLQNNGFEVVCPGNMCDKAFVSYRMSDEEKVMIVSFSEEGASVQVEFGEKGSCTGMLSYKEAFDIVLDYFYPESATTYETIIIEPKDSTNSIILDKESSEQVGYIKAYDNTHYVVKFKRENDFYTCIKTYEGEDLDAYLEAVDKANAYFNAQMIVGSDGDIDTENCDTTYKGEMYGVKEKDVEDFIKALMGYIK